jgi:alanyl-tRNA synthetase
VREGELRLIEIEGFDLTPCGGTHAYRTGEVGMIGVRSWERAKGLTRIEFVAGIRALADYRRANKSARETAALFSTGRDDASALASHMLEENKDLNRRVRMLEEVVAGVEAERFIDEQRPQPDGSKVIAKVFDDRDAESLKKLAHALIAFPKVIALLFSTKDDTARMVFARSADAKGDMNQFMKKACEMLDGRGGGKPELAQGGGKHINKIGETIDALLVMSDL